MLYSASNAKLRINGREILASQAQLSLSTSLAPKYTIGQRSTTTYVPSQGIGGKLDFTYYFTGDDYFRGFITGQGEIARDATEGGLVVNDSFDSPPDAFANSEIMSGDFGGLNFKSGYLTSYSVNFAPNSSVVASAQVSFFDELAGEFTPTDEVPLIVGVGRIVSVNNISQSGGDYVNGTHYDVSLIGGGGEGAKATVVVVDHDLTSVTITSEGVNYRLGSTLDIDDTAIEGAPASCDVAVLRPEILNFKNAVITATETDQPIDNFIAGAYNYSSDVKPVYLMNDIVPSRINFGQKTVNMNFEVDNLTGTLPITGSFAKINVSLKDAGGIVQDGFICSGIMNQRNVASAVGDYIKQSINIVQNETSKSIRVNGIGALTDH